MIKLSFTFNGDVKMELTGETPEDRKLLGLAFDGKEVRSIVGVKDGVILKIGKSEKKAPEVPAEADRTARLARTDDSGTDPSAHLGATEV